MTVTDVGATTDPIELARQVGLVAAEHAAEHDRTHSFVKEAYDEIRRVGYSAIAVPQEFGGGGADLATTCAAQRELGRSCGSTALAVAMHQHTMLTLAWRWRVGTEDYVELLHRIVDERLILSSSGTLDPSSPSLTYRPVDGGVLVSGSKRLSSGSPGSDLLFSLGGDDSGEWIANLVIPLDAGGVSVVDDWYAMGMRGSGSNTVALTDVFVSEENVFLRRRRPQPEGLIRGAALPGLPQPQRSPGGPVGRRAAPVAGVRMPGLMIALPVIVASYLGVADEVHDRVIEEVRRRPRRAQDPVVHSLIGRLHAAWVNADLAMQAMTSCVDDDALGTEALFRQVMTCKREVVTSAIHVAELAMEALGSASYLESFFERALRDLRAGVTHPMSPEQTLAEIGRSLIHVDDQAGDAGRGGA